MYTDNQQFGNNNPVRDMMFENLILIFNLQKQLQVSK